MRLVETSITLLQLSMNQHPGDGVIEELTSAALSAASTNPSHNTYLWQDQAWTIREAARSAKASMQTTRGRVSASHRHALLRGIPVSVKDCFDLAGSPTSCGTKFYRDLNGIAAHDSWMVEQLRKNGAILTGKTHLHPLAYGITGENPDFGDCLQPGHPDLLTGGSSSGAAASILEGSAMLALGTDTGGSIRVPAALCGLVGYRASIGWGDWRGGAHLAPSFDTMGFLCQHLGDINFLHLLLEPTPPPAFDLSELVHRPQTFAIPDRFFLEDAEPAILEALDSLSTELQQLGLKPSTVPVDWWSDSREIFAPIQASEAAQIHRGHFDAFEPSIAERLHWGASLTETDILTLRQRHANFRNRMDALLAEHEFLLMPAAPVTRLEARTDHSQTRSRLLRYTTPVSLAGMPAVTIPPHGASEGPLRGAGMQLVAARGKDKQLVSLAQRLDEDRKKRART